MTFAKFAAIAAAYRPDVEVTRHNGFQEQSGVGVVFRQFNGSSGGGNRIYRYKGSYSDILNRLGIKVVTWEEYESVRFSLQHAREQHGKVNIFSGKPQDRSREIAEYEELLRRFQSDEYVREWEFSVPGSSSTATTEG